MASGGAFVWPSAGLFIDARLHHVCRSATAAQLVQGVEKSKGGEKKLQLCDRQVRTVIAV